MYHLLPNSFHAIFAKVGFMSFPLRKRVADGRPHRDIDKQ